MCLVDMKQTLLRQGSALHHCQHHAQKSTPFNKMYNKRLHLYPSHQVGTNNIYDKSIPLSLMHIQVLTKPEIGVTTVCLTVDQGMVKTIAKHFLLCVRHHIRWDSMQPNLIQPSSLRSSHLMEA